MKGLRVVSKGALTAVVVAAAMTACKVDQTRETKLPSVDVDVKEEGQIPKFDVVQTQEGKMPDVDVRAKPGQMPAFEVETADIEVGTTEKTVPVPDVDVDVKSKDMKVKLPDVDIEMPGEEEDAAPGT